MKKLILPLALCLTMLLSACGQTGSAGSSIVQPSGSAQSSSAQSEPQVITAEQAHDRIQSGDELVILDVRTAEEYAGGHIPGALLLPNEEIGDTRPAQLPMLDTEILIYCRSGNRSAQAAAKLSALGYTNVYDFGGINDWSYETEEGAWTTAAKDGTLSSFAAYDLSGILRDESIFSGHKLTMVNVWATYCGPCLSEMPELGALAEEYKDKGVQIIGIVSDVPQSADGSYDQSQVENARSLANQTGAKYLHLVPSMDLVRAKLQTVSAVPTTFFVDETGAQVGDDQIGARRGSDWAAIIDSLLPEVGA